MEESVLLRYQVPQNSKGFEKPNNLEKNEKVVEFTLFVVKAYFRTVVSNTVRYCQEDEPINQCIRIRSTKTDPNIYC